MSITHYSSTLFFKDNDANSCYFSASASHTEHTDNYYSTDEHENIFQHTKLHSSDSGADLSERNILEKHLENINDEYHRRNSKMNDEDDEMKSTQNEETPSKEYHHERNNSLPELFGDGEFVSGWEKYWAKNGERLIWQSWIERYIDYINPEYLASDNVSEATVEAEPIDEENAFSFDPKDVEMASAKPESSIAANTKIIISSSSPAQLATDDLLGEGWNPLSPASTVEVPKHHHAHRHHHHSEIDNLLSPRCESVNSSIPLTIGASDSMTNVTRMTISSYDFCSSHVTSESTPTSTPTESLSSVTSYSDSEESEMPMTARLSADCEKLLMENKPDEHIPPPSDCDPEEYWQMRWQNHAQEQFVKHYNEFMEAHRVLQQEMSNSFKSDSGFLQGDTGKFSKRRKRSTRKKHPESLQRLVANLNLKSDLAKYSKTQDQDAPVDGNDQPDPSQSDSTIIDTAETSIMESMGLPISFGNKNAMPSKGNDGEEPPEDRAITLKRSHESDTDEPNVDRIKSHFELMGFAFLDKTSIDGAITAGDIVYRKKHVRLHNRMLKMMPSTATKPKHTYFDDDGNEIVDNNQLETEEMVHTSSDEDAPPKPARINIPFTSQLSSDANPNEESEPKVNINLSIDQENDNEPNCEEEAITFDDGDQERQPQVGKKEKKKKRKGKLTNIPMEIANDKTLKKFWYKRFSLFSMFDNGIRLDRGKFINCI